MNILLDNNHDLDLTNNRISLASGIDAVADHLKIRLSFFSGEWFLDVRQGMPYLRELYVKNPNVDLLQSIFRRAILDTPGVDSVDSLTLDIDTRTREATVRFGVTLNTGDVLTFEPFIVGI